MTKHRDKFEFGVDFQELILQLTVTDKIKGPRLIRYYEDSYFTLISHAVISLLLKRYYKKKKRIPSEPILREQLRVFYTKERLAKTLTGEDKSNIDRTITTIYGGIPTESEDIIDKCITFARFVNFKNELENIDITDYDSYVKYADRLKNVQNIGIEDEQNYGIFIVRGMKDRAYNRDLDQPNPTPFWQLNKLLNSHGLGKANLIMLMSQQKRFKTGSLLNVGISYMKLRKKVLYIDLENGEVVLTTRTEQSIGNVNQETIIKSEIDKKLMKVFRRYARVGAEMIIKRMPAYRTTSETIRTYIHELKQKFGIVVQILIIDYGDLLGSLTKTPDDNKRISDSYVEIHSMADEEEIESVWTASHVNRKAEIRTSTIYQPSDVAKCIDKFSHLDMAIGIQESDEEVDAGVLRWEIIAQRNGARSGKILFWLDIEKQRLKEFSKLEVNNYYEQLGEPPIKKSKKHGDL